GCRSRQSPSRRDAGLRRDRSIAGAAPPSHVGGSGGSRRSSRRSLSSGEGPCRSCLARALSGRARRRQLLPRSRRGGVAAAARNRYLAAMSEADPAPRAYQRKPDWIRVKAPVSQGYMETRALMRRLNLATVCEEAACPNIGECWTKKHATVMILGDTCTRACAFCNVKTGMPRPVDPFEPQHVADAAAELGLEHIVVTSVDRDDLPDGGASQFVKVIEALRRTTPSTTIEILTPDFRGKM